MYHPPGGGSFLPVTSHSPPQTMVRTPMPPGTMISHGIPISGGYPAGTMTPMPPNNGTSPLLPAASLGTRGPAMGNIGSPIPAAAAGSPGGKQQLQVAPPQGEGKPIERQTLSPPSAAVAAAATAAPAIAEAVAGVDSQQSLGTGKATNRPTSSGIGFGSKAPVECEDRQCAEEECDPEECGDETRAPRNDNFTCGMDRRPLLPLLLILTTLSGALQMVVFQFPLIREYLYDSVGCVRAFLTMLYVVTLGCMAYCVLGDPGQLANPDYHNRLSNGDDSEALPKRCHKSWLYQLPIRRYDHYCRWLTNCIGLWNHREFIVMCIGLVTIGVGGAIIDAYLLFCTARQGDHEWITAFFLVLHMVYSSILTGLAYPILRLHLGFISRNELANEWKRNDFYVITRSGKKVPVTELSDDEFNDRFDYFEYDKSMNSFDKDVPTNCWTFWCTPRWEASQLGEF